nr:sulfotransferase family 2 domain-containing protein [Candidatus Electrothrix aestuarii]
MFKTVVRLMQYHPDELLHRVKIRYRSLYREIVFMHIPKNAGTSIKRLCRYNGITIHGHDIRSEGYVFLDEYIKTRRIRPYVFAIVRNPWDRVVSSYFYLVSGGYGLTDQMDKEKYLQGLGAKDFEKFVMTVLAERKILKQLHFKPQVDWVYFGGKSIVDKVYKFENLNDGMRDLGKKFKLDVSELTRINKSDHLDYRTYYNRETIEIVGNIYSKDIEMWNYKFDS